MDALKIEKAILAGFDWGARTADIVAALRPERCKALVSVSGYLIGSQESGKLPLPPAFETDFSRAFAGVVTDLSADILSIELKHIDRLSRLPPFHRDPFDRLIIAQSMEENLTVMTRDRAFAAYPGLQLATV